MEPGLANIRSQFFKCAAIVVGALLVGTTASAGTNWSIGINVPGVVVEEPAPVYVAPAPVFAPPPPVYYRPPPPVYYRPAPPAYYQPAPVYYGPPARVYEGPGYREGHRHHRRDWDEDRD